jgi:hypothetical protein
MDDAAIFVPDGRSVVSHANTSTQTRLKIKRRCHVYIRAQAPDWT